MVVVALVAALALCAGFAAGRLRARRRRSPSQRDALCRLAAEAFPGGVLLLFDRRLRHALATGRGLKAIGLSPREVEGRTVREAFPAEVGAVFEPAYRGRWRGASRRSSCRTATATISTRSCPS